MTMSRHRRTRGCSRRSASPRAGEPQGWAPHSQHTKQTEGGQPVHSSRGLLGHLSTIIRSTLRATSPSGPPVNFLLVTEPTPLQRQALDLLGVNLPIGASPVQLKRSAAFASGTSD